MERNREARRTSMATSNGLSRRRHRSSSLRDSPEEDGAVEMPETVRLRDRGGKKDRDRERDRDRDRSSRSKRRRGDRLMHGSNREDGGEESTEESVNDDEEEDEDDAGAMRMLPPNPSSLSSSMSNHQHRKSYPPAKVVRAPPVWKAADEMIGVSVPRKARSASTKRSHECWASGVGGVAGEQIHRQASTSPVRPNLVTASTAAAAASPASISPSSSNVSIRKKMKPIGPKLRPPKSSSKASSSVEEDIEIEVAEALAVMRQSQGPSKQEILASDSPKFDPREVNKSSNEAKSRVSSPISNSPSSAQQSSSMLPQNSNSSAPPLSAVGPKRKRPRPRHEDESPAIFGLRNSPISSTAKLEIDQPAKIESPSPNLEKNQGFSNENGGVPYDLINSQSLPASSEPQLESIKLVDSKPLTEEAESRDVGMTKEEPSSPNKESPLPKLDDDRQDATGTRANSTISDVENQQEEKFQIDLMAPPPQMRSSPERDSEINFVAADPKPIVSDMDTEIKPMVKEAEKMVKAGKDEAMNAETEEKAKSVVDEAGPHKSIVNREKNIDLQLDLEKHDRDTGNGSVGCSKPNQHVLKQQQQPKALKEEQNTDKTAQSSGSLPLPLSVASWPGGLPPMGYMAPLQGVVSMDGSTVPSAAIQPPHFLFSQPRPKRCATHCYIAWNICQHQQFTRMNPFWPAAAGTPSLYGAKPCNLNVLPSVDLHGNFPGRNGSALQDKGQGLAIFSGHVGKDKGSQAANPVDAAHRKQILLQQSLPPGATSSILHGPFIFPLGQQQAVVAAAASARPGSVKSPPPTSSAASSSASNSAPVSASTTAAATTPFPGTATAMSFNYPNLPTNDAQYLAILQNNGYPFPIPAHVGAAPAYRGPHAQAVPFFNGTFYSSQMLHPSQLQQQQQQQQQPAQQPQQIQHGHQNASISSGSSSSQKHLQNHPQQQQQRPHGSGGSGSLQSFPAPKNRPAQPPVMQHPQHGHVQLPHQARQLEAEVGSEDSPSTADSRVSRSSQNAYGQGFAMPLHPSNFALVAPPASLGSASGASANHGEKKQQQQPQQPGLKAGVEPLPSQAFAMSFASINGAATAPGLDISSMAQSHAILQSLPEAARHGYHIITAAQAAQQKKNYRATEEGKSGIGDSSSVEEERKALAGKAGATVGQFIAFSRPDLPDASVTTIPGNGVIDSSARTLNLSSAPPRASASASPAVVSTPNAPNSQQRQQQQQQQQQQMIQLQKQHQFASVAAATAARSNKTPATSNGSVYSDHLPSSSMAAKFPNAVSAFPQNLVQGSSSPGQSPQWKNTVRTSNSQVPTLALSSSASSLKNLPQQQGRSQQNHIQISFAANPKSSAQPQGQQPPPNSNQSPSPPMMVGSPTSLSKSTGGSPRTTPTSTGNKTSQASSLSSQQAKNSSSVPSRKSSPVGGRNVPSILGNPHITSSNSGPKPSMQQQQQQLSKQSLQQTQLFFSNTYLQTQSPHSTTSTSSASSGYYHLQRRRSEQQPQQQQPQGSSSGTSTGMLTLCPPVSLASASTSDPAKAIAAAAAAASNMKGGLPSQGGIIHAAQFAAAAAAQSSGNPHSLMPASFPYVHAVPTAVQVKPAEQKQPAGNGGFLTRK